MQIIPPNDNSPFIAIITAAPGYLAALWMLYKWRVEKRGLNASSRKSEADGDKTEAETVNIWQDTYNKIIAQLADRDMKMSEMRQDIENLKLENSRTKTINNHLTEENSKLLEERTSLKLRIINLEEDLGLLQKQVTQNTNAIGD